MSSPRVVYINLPSKDIDASKRFASALGLIKKFDGGRDGMRSASFAYSDSVHIFYHSHETWERWLFQGRKTADAHQVTQSLISLGAESPEEVESLVGKAIGAGGKRGPRMVPEEEKWGMYSRTVEDPDGHVYEIVYSSHQGDCGV
ncbi:hypothetical protein LOZ53_000917 [Ophidiomyces ophidiicola]|uniref:Uncharacterized protein n=1 Tax=Ophidiomyces ophidiicola TaxID=1387563 RepID=A0ACB8V5Z5_9EURO|nr:uncharacterized protein LOZ57_000300 [Ophidiomyces ophidiicola]KAI1916009.1 hypothetical protein LOZ61_001349 [Ophidiomyces ophidiicola]KAI1922999.1 hypothetical protein LOZ64_001086 [Ophidiomyces ophidiicola]KAI1930561.1 hypothetical protein LOZ60_000792 [Ophidiomyces ophidiicola]KAI1940807.1 hypothetical protein LOZ62_004834 [Ophidiomyces ophidiicola]KAI1953958.1 hypothetical protein LOZ57_000300 [Ophidiomyces ophidiicola]